MKVSFKGDLQSVRKGLTYAAPELGIELTDEYGDDCITVIAEQVAEDTLEVFKSDNAVVITYSKPVYFFRALSILKERKNEERFDLKEKPQFDMCGAMFDVTQGNAVINIKTVKMFLRKMAIMGLNMLMLYTETSYEVPEEPYFGYMRGRYSETELRELDDYAYELGIEIIPCIQTLAHLCDVLRWYPYHGYREDNETLLVGDERTYTFLEHLIAAATRPFRTNRIHIGMDEAWKLGQGTYLLKNGYRPKHEIMKEHLDRVLKIVEKYGKTPMIWSDMYIRSVSKTGSYHDRDVVVTPELRATVPEGLQLVYWDYSHFTQEDYEYYTDLHKQLSPNVIFAGGIWTWQGYSATYDITNATTNCALNACKQKGIRDVFATIWGDAGTESSVLTVLLGLQLYAEHMYSPDEPSVDTVARRFRTCTGCEYEDFYNLTYFDQLDRTESAPQRYGNASKYLMWQNVMTGLFDANMDSFALEDHYEWVEQRMTEAVSRGGEFEHMFEFYRRVAAVLKVKAGLGIKLTCAYKSGDREYLEEARSSIIDKLITAVESLRAIHQENWYDIYKAFGWEIMDLRYGSLVMQLRTAEKRISDYLDGNVEKLEEFEMPRLYYSPMREDGVRFWPNCNSFINAYTASMMH